MKGTQEIILCRRKFRCIRNFMYSKIQMYTKIQLYTNFQLYTEIQQYTNVQMYTNFQQYTIIQLYTNFRVYTKMHYTFVDEFSGVYENSLQMSHEVDEISCVYEIACPPTINMTIAAIQFWLLELHWLYINET